MNKSKHSSNQSSRFGAPSAPRRSGFTLVEVLAASVIVGVCIAAVVSMWSFAFRLSATSDRESVGSSLGRRAVEEVKQSGFQDATEGTTTVYYDSQGGSRGTTQNSSHAYSVSTTIASDLLNGSQPASGALRTVTVQVTFLSTGTTVYQCSTYLARAGV